MKQPDKRDSLEDNRIPARRSSLKRGKSSSQTNNPTNSAGNLQETESWIKTTVDRLLGPIRFF